MKDETIRKIFGAKLPGGIKYDGESYDEAEWKNAIRDALAAEGPTDVYNNLGLESYGVPWNSYLAKVRTDPTLVQAIIDAYAKIGITRPEQTCSEWATRGWLWCDYPELLSETIESWVRKNFIDKSTIGLQQRPFAKVKEPRWPGPKITE